MQRRDAVRNPPALAVGRFKIIFILFLITAFMLPQFAEAAYLNWGSPRTNADGTRLTDLGGFRVYCGTSSGNYTINKDAGMSRVLDTSGWLTQGTTYFCAVKAYDTSGNESEYSNEVNFTETKKTILEKIIDIFH